MTDAEVDAKLAELGLTPVGRGSSELYDTVRIDTPENRRVTIVTLRP